MQRYFLALAGLSADLSAMPTLLGTSSARLIAMATDRPGRSLAQSTLKVTFQTVLFVQDWILVAFPEFFWPEPPPSALTAGSRWPEPQTCDLQLYPSTLSMPIVLVAHPVIAILIVFMGEILFITCVTHNSASVVWPVFVQARRTDVTF